MLVLFSIAVGCFFVLFGMLLIVLRQAKSEGAAARRRERAERKRQRAARAEHLSHMPASFGDSQSGIGLNLSNLVPAKQPDWRFMVREAGKRRKQPQETSGKKPPRPFHYGVNRPDRAYSNKDLGDLTDPQASHIARQA